MKHPPRLVRDDDPAPRGADVYTLLGCAVLLAGAACILWALFSICEALR
jgi:hypothetical protein